MDNPVTNRGTRPLLGPTEVSRRRNIHTVHFQSDTPPAPIHLANPLHSANPRPISQSDNPNPILQYNANPRSICQVIVNPITSPTLTPNWQWIGTCHANRWQIQCQSHVNRGTNPALNLGTSLLQRNRRSVSTEDHFATSWPIQSNGNPRLICQSLSNPPIQCQSSFDSLFT